MPRRDIKNLSFNSFHNYTLRRSGDFVDKEITCILWGLCSCDIIFHPHFLTFCFATFNGRILQSGIPCNPDSPFPSGTGQLNHSPLRDDKDEVLEEPVAKSSWGQNIIRLRCGWEMFVLRVFSAAARESWGCPGMLVPAFLFDRAKGTYIQGVNVSWNQSGESLGC